MQLYLLRVNYNVNKRKKMKKKTVNNSTRTLMMPMTKITDDKKKINK